MLQTVSGEEGSGVLGHAAGECQCLLVELLEQSVLAHHAQLLPVGVVSERLDHVETGVDELFVQRRHLRGLIEDDFGPERPAGM